MKEFFLLVYIFYGIFILNSLPSLAQSKNNQMPVLYRCKGGKTFQAEFGINLVNLQLKRDQIFNLTSVKSASGNRYSDGKVTLYTKGEEAFIEVNKKVTHDGCNRQNEQDLPEIYYNCDSQIAPFPRKEDVSLAQAKKLVTLIDGDFFIYHCSPR